ncbi:MAG: hypothetical protein AAF471_00710 [Myxococcota bacterium]
MEVEHGKMSSLVIFGYRCLCLALVVLLSGCTQHALHKRPALHPLRQGKPIEEPNLRRAMEEFPKDAVWLAMLQGFALLRQPTVHQPRTRAQARALLEQAVASFEDLRDPDNFSVAFTSDADKPYRGRPHERVLTAITLALLDMAKGRHDMALATLRNGEFLSARWQRTAVGTTTPIIYALMLRCQHVLGSSRADIEQTRERLARVVRLRAAQQPLLQLLQDARASVLRPDAAAVQLAGVLLEAGVSNALLQSPRQAALEQLLQDAGAQAKLVVGVVRDRFADLYNQVIDTRVRGSARVQGIQSPRFEQAVFDRVPVEIDALVQRMGLLLTRHEPTRAELATALATAQQRARQIEKAVRQPRVDLLLTGTGPTIIREGQYKEITRIVPGAGAKTQTGGLWHGRAPTTTNAPCGFHRRDKETLQVVLCGTETFGGARDVASKGVPAKYVNEVNNFAGQKGPAAPPQGAASSFASKTSDAKNKPPQGVQLWSSSTQATTVMGRPFDRILRGRAQLRSLTHKTATVGMWSALILFYAASATLANCQSDGSGNQACTAVGVSLMIAAGATIGVSGLLWLAGLPANPEADPRYVPTIFESIHLVLPGDSSP